MNKLFPEHLSPGSKGPAVTFLQQLYQGLGYNRENIIADSEYGPATTKGTRQLQRDLDIDDNGHFGPDTRKALLEKTGLDVDAIPALPDQA